MLTSKCSTQLWVAAAFLAASLRADAGVTDEVAPCVVFLVQDVSKGQEAKYGSGFLVKKGATPYVVTASHIANGVGANFRIVLPDAPRPVPPIEMRGAKWMLASRSDVAALSLHSRNQPQNEALLRRCLSADRLVSRPLPPSRDVSLTVMGYPLELGANGFVSPLCIETQAASGFISLPRGDTKRHAAFILLQNPSVGGMSGGPVFDTGKPLLQEEGMKVREGGVSVVGLIHGVIADKTGGKFAAVVPSSEIADLIGAKRIPESE